MIKIGIVREGKGNEKQKSSYNFSQATLSSIILPLAYGF